MTILHGRQEIEEFQRKFTEAFAEEQSGLAAAELIADMELSAYQGKFRELFADTAPGAWSELQALSATAIQWLGAEIDRIRHGSKPEIIAEISFYHRVLVKEVEAWTKVHGIEAGWVQLVALMTVHGIAYSQIGQLENPPTTLLFNRFPTLTIDGDEVEFGWSNANIQPYSTVRLNVDLGDLEWDTLKESKAQFRERVLETYKAALNEQLDSLGQEIPSSSHLGANEDYVTWLIRRHVNRKPHRSLAKDVGKPRSSVIEGIRKARELLDLPAVPENWGVEVRKKSK